jgi:transcription-repair coupling factor (superfamily II helicase)
MLEVLRALKKGAGQINITGLRGGSAAYLAARIASSLKQPLLCIVPSEDLVAVLEQDLSFFIDLPIIGYPGYEIPPYTPLSPDSGTITTRLGALYRILTGRGQFIMVASAEAMLRRTLPLDQLANLAELVIVNEECDRDELINNLTAAGYESVSLVQSPGEFTVRGGIIDIFPPPFDHAGSKDPLELPVRLDFFGDTVESIRYFDPITQRSRGELEEAVFLPVSEILFPSDSDALNELGATFKKMAKKWSWRPDETRRILEKIKTGRRFPGIEFFLPLFYKELSSPFASLPKNTIILSVNPNEITRSQRIVRERIKANYEEARAKDTPALPPETLFLPETELTHNLSRQTQVNLSDFAAMEGTETTFQLQAGNHTLIKQELDLKRKKQGALAPLAQRIISWQERHEPIGIGCRSLRRARLLVDLLTRHQIHGRVEEQPFLAAPPTAEEPVFYASPLSTGFDLEEEGLHLLSENELFGKKRIGPKKKQQSGPMEEPVCFEELHEGDIVVHDDHGLGAYDRMITMELHGITNDFLQISYKGGDKLYVPVDRLGAVSKYKGISERQPKIDTLGGKSWPKAKKKVKEAVWKVAQDLLDLYARRQLATGTSFTGPDELYHALEESFPFDETHGQIKAINDVTRDLTSERTMDRLVCGDVGYGKTEVAVRAAFKVISDSHQVAILVPTTVLAEQHAESFRERFSGFPVRVESLNRFRSTAEQKKIIRDLAAGRVDLVIGTHRLLSKDVSFKNLGLLIIDEEHRFGVTHKEKLKKLRHNVDVLTLTATPIPRTLQLSLLGVRDLSVISSPPRHRRTVKTFVARHDDLVIKEAIVRELQRGGQVFLVHNRVQSIHEMARKVQELVPEARISVGHGQMAAKNLEEIMVRFVKREIDVLVCTTIIESGLDIPNANTIIITRADRFGLAAIYQLRGRVGRSSEQAYAYLLVPSLDGLSKDARQRLRALMDYNELGGGFKLAMSDLQIRGGGNILGESQSGNIAAVGYDLYLDLLQRTVEDLKRRAESGDENGEEEVEPEINLSISAYIPENFIRNTDQRYITYRKLTSLNSAAELDDMEDELRDRYGSLPVETLNLLTILLIKIDMKQLKIKKLEQGKDTFVLSFHHQTPVKPETILGLVNKSKNRIKFTPDSRMVIREEMKSPPEVFAAVKNILRVLERNDR